MNITKSDFRLQHEKYTENQDIVLLTFIGEYDECEFLFDNLKKALVEYLKNKKKRKKKQ